jgi:signal peptidase I
MERSSMSASVGASGVLSQVSLVLAWLAVPVGLVCMLDDWLFRPRRRMAGAAEPPLLSLAYRLLPLLIAAAVLRLLIMEQIDFSALLVAVCAASGAVWAADSLFLSRRRRRAAAAAGKSPAEIPEPGTVDYARSFFPVLLTVLVLRSFVFEPFRIPSDSMMPTLRDGDFILVDKFTYGLRLPIVHTRLLRTGEPKRGDVVVFHPPMDPSQVWIKRVVGLPDDHVVAREDRLTIDGHIAPFEVSGTYSDGCYENMRIATERLGAHVHQALLCPVPLEITPQPPSSCPRTDARGYFCGGTPPPDAVPLPDPAVFDRTVPPGKYMMMGDNRDNSDDSRYWGFVTEQELIGRATYVWFSWDPHRSGWPLWGRIGTKIN